MKIISIDVGIKNCSFCVLSQSIETKLIMEHWDIVNLIELNPVIHPVYECTCYNYAGTKKEKKCVKQALYKKGLLNNNYLCEVHAKKDPYFNIKELLLPALKKALLKELICLTNKYNINTNNVKKKNELIDLLVSHQNIHGVTLINSLAPKKKCATIPLQIIGRNIIQYFDTLNVRDITHVIIENQIGSLATRMKTIQGMLMQYFFTRNTDVCVEFISATNKLKKYSLNNSHELTSANNETNKTNKTNKKKQYDARKKKAVATSADIIQTTDTLAKWNDYFISCKKKDDLSDCFLQGIWFLEKMK